MKLKQKSKNRIEGFFISCAWASVGTAAIMSFSSLSFFALSQARPDIPQFGAIANHSEKVGDICYGLLFLSIAGGLVTGKLEGKNNV